jgi:hypothetical protein
VAQLKAGIALKCVVIRDGSESEIEARDLVPGDVIVLEEGKTIAADAKVSDARGGRTRARPQGRTEGPRLIVPASLTTRGSLPQRLTGRS